jgi:hypothetical protein
MLPMHIIHPDQRMEVREVAVSDHLAMFAVPTFGPPGILAGHSGTDSCGSWTYISNPEVMKQHPEGTRVGRVEFHARTYARMLAKIAHAFAVAREGVDTHRYLLPDFILDKTNLPPDYFVGCLAHDLPKEETMHRVSLDRAQLGDGRKYLTANIRLFAKLGAPQYHVVVAELPSEAVSGGLSGVTIV